MVQRDLYNPVAKVTVTFRSREYGFAPHPEGSGFGDIEKETS
jgi:hypothetical protein